MSIVNHETTYQATDGMQYCRGASAPALSAMSAHNESNEDKNKANPSFVVRHTKGEDTTQPQEQPQMPVTRSSSLSTMFGSMSINDAKGGGQHGKDVSKDDDDRVEDSPTSEDDKGESNSDDEGANLLVKLKYSPGSKKAANIDTFTATNSPTQTGKTARSIPFSLSQVNDSPRTIMSNDKAAMLLATKGDDVIVSSIKPVFDKEEKGKFFHDKAVLLLVSNDQKYYKDDDHFAAIISLLIRCNPKMIYVLNTAYLQRTDRDIFGDGKKSAEDLAKQAQEEEEEWDKERAPYIRQLPTEKTHILRSSSFILSKDFQTVMQLVEDWFNQNLAVQAEFRKTAEDFLKANSSKTSVFDKAKHESSVAKCIKYLKEEIAMLYVMIPKQYPCNYIFYPKHITSALKKGFEEFILQNKKPPAPTVDNMQWTTIDLKPAVYKSTVPNILYFHTVPRQLGAYQGFSWYVKKEAKKSSHSRSSNSLVAPAASSSSSSSSSIFTVSTSAAVSTVCPSDSRCRSPEAENPNSFFSIQRNLYNIGIGALQIQAKLTNLLLMTPYAQSVEPEKLALILETIKEINKGIGKLDQIVGQSSSSEVSVAPATSAEYKS